MVLAAAAAKPLSLNMSNSGLFVVVLPLVLDGELVTGLLKLWNGKVALGKEVLGDKRLRLESMAFMATKAGDMPGKRPPKAKGLGKWRGENSDSVEGGAGRLLLSISSVNPG